MPLGNQHSKKGALLIWGIILVCLLGLWCLISLLGGNNPWPREISETNTYFLPYAGEIKSLDPAVSYYEHEQTIIDAIVEMPLCYDYLKRPYELRPMLLTKIPVLEELTTADGKKLYRFSCEIRPGVRYQPTPAISDARRTLKAEDFRVAIARLSDPAVASPVYSTLSSFLFGMEEASAELEKLERKKIQPDYRKVKLPCFQEKDDLHFDLILSRKYPQALYWMAMHFFAPIPYEAVEYFRRPEMMAQGKNLGNTPIGTGGFLLKEHIPNSQIILERNPHYRNPCHLDRVVLFCEREAVPAWIKFNQGYYDLSGIPKDSYDNAIAITPEGALGLSPRMQKAGISLKTGVRLVSYYYGFNMLDPVIGGTSPQKCKLRQALSIAIDAQDEIDIFMNGRGVVAQGIIPPGLPGGTPTKEHYNHYLFKWDEQAQQPVRRTMEEAKQLMKEAGYPNGIGPDGKQLAIRYDHSSAGVPGFKPTFIWLRDKFAKLGVELIDNGTDLNRMRDKIRQGNFQMTMKGWVADYPDVENFLFLFYSPNGHVKSNGRGSNYTNYASKEYDQIFQQLESMTDGTERDKLIQQANEVLWRDCPCAWNFHPVSFTLVQPWIKNYMPQEIGKTFLPLIELDAKMRQRERRRRNGIHLFSKDSHD